MARLAFENIIKPSVDEKTGEEKYGSLLLFKPGQDLSAVEAAIMEVAEHFFKRGIPGGIMRRSRESKSGYPLNDQTDKAGQYRGFTEGALYLGAYSKNQPGVVEYRSATEPAVPVAPERLPEFIYAGCYAQAHVTFYPYDNKNKGIGVSLEALRFVKHGEKLFGFNAEQTFSEKDADLDAWLAENGTDEEDDYDLG